MDHLPRSGSRHHPPPPGKQPPTGPTILTRCKSQNPATSPPPAAITSNRSNTFTKSRSISATKTRSYREPEVGSNFLPRKKPTSPSAWALSPGRVAPCPSPAPMPVQLASPGGRSRTSSGGISGVLKYFRPKKAASSEDADMHSFKLVNNRLLQWRYANALAETAMSIVKQVAENKLFNAWVEILALRHMNMKKRLEVQKLRNKIKLCHVIYSQMVLLEKWSRIEGKNFEAVSRVVRKLTVASANVPLLHDSKGDVSAVRDVLDTANMLLNNIETTISKLTNQAEKSCYLLTELLIIAKQEHESLNELQTWMAAVALLKEEERSLRTHLMQAK